MEKMHKIQKMQKDERYSEREEMSMDRMPMQKGNKECMKKMMNSKN